MKHKSHKSKITFIIIFFVGAFLFFNIIFFLLKTNKESFSKKYVSFIEKNNNELSYFFYELDSIKNFTNTFYINYHLNMNELYSEDSNRQNSLYFDKNETRIKELFKKYDISEIKYIPNKKDFLNVEFPKVTRFGTIPNDLKMSYKIDNTNSIIYHFILKEDTINFKSKPLKK